MDFGSVLITGTFPAIASVLSIFALLYVIGHKLKRILFYSIGKKESDAGIKKVSVMKAFVVFNSRLMKDKLSAFNHSLIILGLVLSLVGFLFNAVQIITNTIGNSIFLQGSLFNAISISLNIGAVLLLAGSVSALLRRLAGKTKRLEKSLRHILPLIVFMFAALAGMVFEGFKSLLYENGNIYSFMGYALLSPVKGLLVGWKGLYQAYIFSWCLLSAAAIMMILSLIAGIMPHLSASMLNLMYKKGMEPGRLKNTEKQINDYYGKNIELDGSTEFGAKYIEDLNRDQLTQLDACAECGRCDSVCPACLSGKKLAPKKLLLANRGSLNAFKGNKQSRIADSEEVREMVWECSMCYACENECPSLIEHVDRISGIRRNLIMNSGETLPEHKKVIENLYKGNNPFGLDRLLREAFIKELGIPYLEKGNKVDYVLWLGCHAYFDGRMRSVVSSMLNILKKAGKSFAVLKEETCCGDPLRRIGDEFKFQEILNRNKQIFMEYGVEDILTLCPHCFNSFKTEYPSLGCPVNALHYLEVLDGLIKKNGGQDKGEDRKRVFYHDSCYLGRINNLYNQPRLLLENMKHDYELVEIEDEKEDSLCCGGGGGRIWCDEKPANRPSMLKLKMLKEKKVDIIITSCPYCLSIFTDAKDAGGLPMEAMDLMELLDKIATGDGSVFVAISNK